MPTPPKKTDLSRDLDHDGDVDLADDRSRDLDHDGVIDSADEEEADIDRDHDIDATDRTLAAKKSVGEALGMTKAGQGSQSQAQQQSIAPKIK
ncbi:hypothetical protein [Prosthecobacter sp.]|uniref:hypothetical protein n=1 Tax=Prosthecobacter sp. TaxID=1965333 RepID=UPI003783B174